MLPGYVAGFYQVLVVKFYLFLEIGFKLFCRVL